MWQTLLSLLHNASGNTRPRANRRYLHAKSIRLALESLEERRTPTAGALDPTFGNGAGYVTTALSSSKDQADAAIVQSDGKILVSGYSGPTDQVGLARYNPDGSLDASFGNNGLAFAPAGDSPSAAIYPMIGTANDGKIVMPGAGSGFHAPPASEPNTFSVVRLNANGTPDTSFGTGGIATAVFPTKVGTLKLGSAGASHVIIQPDGKIVAVGLGADWQSVDLARFNADGTLDTTFGQGGMVYTSLGTQQASPPQLLLRPNGDMVAVMTASTGNTLHLELIGYHANGSLNTAFGSGGIVSTPPFGDGFDAVGGATLYPTAGTANDGKIVVVGYSMVSTTIDSEWLVARYNVNGTLDASFGSGGTAMENFSARSDAARGVAIQTDGKLVVTGYSSPANSAQVEVLARLNTNGALDSTFGTGGTVNATIGTSNYVEALALQSDGNIVLAGSTIDGTKGTYDNFLVARFLGHATTPSFVIAGPSSVTAGTAGNYAITVQNPDGTTDAAYSGTIHIASSDPQAVLPADFTVVNGVGSFAATLKTAGNESITATDTLTVAVNGSEAIVVNPAAATHFSVSSPASVAKGDAFSITVTALDAYGNVATGYTGTVRFASSDGSAVLPTNYTFTVADAGVHTFTKLKMKTKGWQTIAVTDTLFGSVTDSWDIDVI